MLSPSLYPQVRSVGTNLLVLWVQGLRENVTQFAEQLFASVIPGIVPAVASCVFPSAEGSDHGTGTSMSFTFCFILFVSAVPFCLLGCTKLISREGVYMHAILQPCALNEQLTVKY